MVVVDKKAGDVKLTFYLKEEQRSLDGKIISVVNFSLPLLSCHYRCLFFTRNFCLL